MIFLIGSSGLTGILLTICVALIMIGAFVYVIQRESNKFKREKIVVSSIPTVVAQ